MSRPRSHPNMKSSTSIIAWIFWVWFLAMIGFSKSQTTSYTITGVTTVTPTSFVLSLSTITSFVGGATQSSAPSSTVTSYTVEIIPVPSLSTTFRETESPGNTGSTSASALSFTLTIPNPSPTLTTFLTTTSSIPSSTGSVTSSPTGNLTVNQNPQSGPLNTQQKGVIGGVTGLSVIFLVGLAFYLWKHFTSNPLNARQEKQARNQQPPKPPTRPRSSYPPREAIEMFNRIWWTRQGTVVPPLEPVKEEVDRLDYQSRERDREAQGRDPFSHGLDDSYFECSGALPIQSPASPRLPPYPPSVRRDDIPAAPSIPLRSSGRRIRSPPPRPQRPESLTESLINTIASVQLPFTGEDLPENGLQFGEDCDRTSQQLCTQIPGDDLPSEEHISTADGPERDATLSPKPLKIVKKSASDTTPYVTRLEAEDEAEVDGDENDYGKTRKFLNKTGERLNPRIAANKVMNRNPRGNGRVIISEPRDGSFITAISNGDALNVGVLSPPGVGLPVENMSSTRYINESRASSLEKITEEEKSRNREETLAALEGEKIEKPLRVEPKYRGSSMYSQDEYGRPVRRAPREEADEFEWEGNKDAFTQNVFNARGTFGSVASSERRRELNWGKLAN